MRDYKNIIKEAELLASSPEAVVAYLKERDSRDGDDALEDTLLELNNPLIDLALAQYGRSLDVLKTLFHRGQLPLRVAVLANQVAWLLEERWIRLNSASLDTLLDRHENLVYLGDQEICALFENPKLDNWFVYEFLHGNALWMQLEDRKRMIAIHALGRSKRIQPPASFDDSNAVFEEVWKLADRVPVTVEWAFTLVELYKPLLPNQFPDHWWYGAQIREPLETIKRWYPSNTEDVALEKLYASTDKLSDSRWWPYPMLRNLIAQVSLYSEIQDYNKTLPERKESLAKERLPKQRREDLSKSIEYIETLLGSEDIALRAAVYSCVNLTPEQVTHACEKDGQLAFNHLVENSHLWRNKSTREVLGNSQNLERFYFTFNLNKARFQKEHPEWFEDKEIGLKRELQESATKEDLNTLTDRILPRFEKLQGEIDFLENNLKYIFWFSVAGLLIAIDQYF